MRRFILLKEVWILILILVLGFALRFTNLGAKSLWLDEIITGLFTFGQGYQIIPRETVFSVDVIPLLFTYQEKSCSEISTFLAQQSTHPPLFFCLMHYWLGALQFFSFFEFPLAVQLRGLSALFGVISILALYQLNRSIFSEKSGLFAAGMMAVSPFAVYLSQEARQYTFLLVLISFALLAMVNLLCYSRHRLFYWLLWGFVNSLGCYTHYFFLLSFLAQIIILFAFLFHSSPRRLLLLIAVIFATILSFLPWLPTFISHVSSSKTDWLPPADLFSPIYQLLLGFIVMLVTFPVENQPLFIQIVSGFFMLAFGGWIVYRSSLGYQYLFRSLHTRKVIIILSSYLFLVLIQFLAAIYILDQNLLIAPRYNYIFLPAIFSLLAATLITPINSQKLGVQWSILGIVGIISSLFVISNLFFLKPYYPQITAQRFNQSSEPILIAMGYKDEMDLALGLSYGLALQQLRDEPLMSKFIFLNRNEGYQRIWNKIEELELNVSQVWVIGTGLKQVAFPERLGLNHQPDSCDIDRSNYYRIGIPYQRYQC